MKETKKSKPAAKKVVKKEAPKPAKKKVEKKIMMDASEAHVAISEYMLKQNRPYSILNVFDNLHGKIPKKILQATLD